MPLHPPRLRDAVEDEGLECCGWIGGRGRAQERRHIACGEEAEAGHRRSVGLVNELVDAPRLEAALEPDVLGRRFHSSRGRLSCEAPA